MEFLPYRAGPVTGKKGPFAQPRPADLAVNSQGRWAGRLATGIAREFKALHREQQERAFFATAKGQSYIGF